MTRVTGARVMELGPPYDVARCEEAFAMTMTGNPHHDPALTAPTDREMLTGERPLLARSADRARPRDGRAVSRELDRELEQSMDASDPPAVLQP